MDLLKALRMPFQAGSLMFVAVSSLLLAFVNTFGGGSIITQLLGIFASWLMLVWLTQFAFTLIDDAANGVEEAAAASVEMLSPYGDPRCWVHPLLVIGAVVLLLLRPDLPRWPVLAGGAVLFPASIAAIAISGHAHDALNPLALARVLRGLGHYYLLAVLWMAACALLGVLIANSGLWSVLRVAALELLVLVAYSFIGGAVYARRVHLGFEPRVSPERVEAREERRREEQRQQMIDGLYRDIRVRESAKAANSAREWIQGASAMQLPADVRAILAAGATWSEPRGLALLLRSLVAQLLALKQPGLAFAAVEAGLAAAPGFAPEQEGDAITMIRYALQTGRKRLAATLLANFSASPAFAAGTGSPELQELRNRLQGDKLLP